MNTQGKIINYIVSLIMVFAMVLGLCASFEMTVKTVKANAFETSIKDFPESYKTKLRALHKYYPKWKFVPYKTNIMFRTAVDKEYSNDRSLIENNFSKYLKSNASGNYNTSTGKYIAKDGGSWVTSSKNAIAYFMDPRNFLDSKHIYMFEQLSYDSKTQTKSGVEAILDGSFMHNTEIGYITTKGKYKSTNTKYSDAILKAAKNSKVSAYYIASKITLEIGTRKNSKYAGMGAGGSVNGQYSKKYTGIYNFYNIGAYTSSDPISNGLAWASSGRTYKRAWTTPQKSIEGGAEYIGEKYINCGQHTTYFQRFNVNAKSTYGLYQHQYMTNVYGAASEASISSDAYEDMGIAKLAKTFIIPVYKGMPSTTAKVTLGKSYKSGRAISAVNVRKGPNTTYTKVITLNKNDKVTVKAGVRSDGAFTYNWLINPYWYKISVKKSGKTYTGYVAASFVRLDSEKTIIKGSTVNIPVSYTKKQKTYYMSDNPAIVKVYQSGKMKGVRAGKTTVRAYTAGGSMSAMEVTVENSYAPKTPTLSGKSAGYNSVKLSWTKESGATGYYLYRRKVDGSYIQVAHTGADTVIFTDKKLITGITYDYKVKAYRTVNKKKYYSGDSALVGVKPVPSKPKKPQLKKNSKSIEITWNKISGAQNYKVYRSESKKGKYKTIATISKGNIITYKDTKVTKKKTYYYSVVAYRKVSGKNVYGEKSSVASLKFN